MSGTMSDYEDVDFMSDSLNLLGEDMSDRVNDGEVRYGELVLRIAPKEGKKRIDELKEKSRRVLKAISLLADQLFSPSLLLAERIERRLIPLEGKTFIELGAGCALPSLLAASNPEVHPSLVVITDYPDEVILSNLRFNVQTNEHCFARGCKVICEGHEWGTDVKPLMSLLQLLPSRPSGFDIVILSDLLHFHNSHPAILTSLTNLLARNRESRAYVAAGTYTPPHVCNNFIRLAENEGLVVEEGEADDIWRGRKEVWAGKKLDPNALGVRKGMCRWWVIRWSDASVERDETPGK